MLLNLATALLGAIPTVHAATLTVGSAAGNKTSPIHYGLLYEDIFHSGDGGLYAELINNRAFQGDMVNNAAGPWHSLEHWDKIGSATISLDNTSPLSPALPYHMRVDIPTGATGETGFWNDGFWGFDVSQNAHSASFYLRGSYTGQIKAEFRSIESNAVLGSTTFDVDQVEADGWIRHQKTFTPSTQSSDPKNAFRLTFDGASVAGSSLRFQMISVFPPTHKGSSAMMREDLSTYVEGLSGKFLRMAGGNNIEGLTAATRWKWNETIGDLKDRPGRPGTWGTMNTDGFGLLEMMQWGKDMNLEIILAVWGGLSFDDVKVPQADLQPYIDEAIELLAFLTDPVTTSYGSLRSSLGYPEPFAIPYVEIGNEDFLHGGIPTYVQYRFNDFGHAIKAKYPDITLVSSIWAGHFAEGTLAEGTIQDLHDYFHIQHMVDSFGSFDNAPRNYPVLIGEYAAIFDDTHPAYGNEINNPNLRSATSEAVYLLGLERNSGFIVGVCHGALIKGLGHEPGNVALLKHNADDVVPSISYYVAKLWGDHFGSETVPLSADVNIGPLYWGATKNDDGMHFIKIVNYNGAGSSPITVKIPGKTGPATLKVLSAPSWDSSNTLGNIQHTLTETQVSNTDGGYTFTLAGEFWSAVLVV